jgi:PKD repeat protein
MLYIPPVRPLITVLVLSVAVGATQSCGTPKSTQSENSPPAVPTMDPVTGAPLDGSIRQTTRPVLSWDCSDPDGDPLSYDVHLGTSEPLPIMSSFRVPTCVVSASLEFSTIYQWRVVARDDHGHATSSDTWTFTTRSDALTCTAEADTTVGLPPVTVTFTGAASKGDPPYAYHWDFGDDSSSTLQNPRYTYTVPGIYDAVLQVTDTESGSCTKSVTIVVEGPPFCQALAMPTAGLPPLVVHFTAEASGGQPPFGYHWWFGDGSESTLELPTHVYTDAGTYGAILVVTDSKSLSCSTSVVIIAGPPVTCIGSGNPTSGPAPLTVSFSALASDGLPPYSYFWTFGDGGSSASQSAGHTYTRLGPFTVVLSVKDDAGSTCTKTLRVLVTP